MAQNFWTAADYALDATTTDAWEARFNIDSQLVKSDVDGKYMEVIHPLSTSGGMRFLPPTDFSDGQALVLMKGLSTGFDNSVIIRSALFNSVGSRNYYAFDVLGSVLRITKYVSGTRTVLQEVSNSISVTAQFWVRLETTSTNVRGRIWADGNAEPSIWNIEVTDSSITGPGFAGLGVYSGTVKVYQYSTGSGGDPAPSSAPSSAPTISAIDGDNAVNQYQLVNIDVSGFTESISSVTIGGVAVASIPDNDPADNVIQVRMPGSGLTTGTYDVVVSGATETDTISGISYTQTHPYTSPYGLVDSNSLFAGQSITEGTYHRIVTGPTNGTLDAATAESQSLWGNDVDDIYTPNEGFTGDDSMTLEVLYSDGTTAQWISTITVSEPDTVGPTITSVGVPTAGTYAPGQNLDFPVAMSEVSFVTGTPGLGLLVGGSARQANYVSGDGTQSLLFRYPVQSGDLDTDGIEITGLTLDGGTIRDQAGNDATLTLNSVGDTSGVLVDGVGPAITINGLTTTDTTPTASGSAGDAVSLTLDLAGVDVVHSSSYTITPSGGNWSQTFPELALGEYTMTLNGEDAVGNAAVQRTATLQVVEQVAIDGDGLFRSLFRPAGRPVSKSLFR